ncbi:hypothetical protein HanPSC8_Chr08g0316971 [Helianthus annuus]|nr:hypothetical protein HanPSC8_Chr08g0316971 [Helianthus annuus]
MTWHLMRLSECPENNPASQCFKLPCRYIHLVLLYGPYNLGPDYEG